MKDKAKKIQWPQLKYFFSFFKPQWKLILFSAIGIYVAVLLQLPLPLVTRYIIDHVLTGGNHTLLNWIILGLFALVVFQQVSGIITAYLSNLFKERVLNSFQLRLFEHMVHLNLSFFDNRKTGYLLRRIEGDVLNLRGLVANNLIHLIKDVLTFIVGTVIIFTFHWKLALASVTVLPFFVYSMSYFSLRIRRRSEIVQEQSACLMGFLQEALSGIFIVKAFQMEKREKERLFNEQQKRMDVNIKYAMLSAFSSHVTAFLGAIGPLIVLWYGSHEVINGTMTLGTLIAFNAFLGYLFGPARRFMHTNEQIQDALASLGRVFEFLSLPTENGSTLMKEKKENIPVTLNTAGKIEFKHVGYAYDENEPVLKNINLTVHPGQTTALVGRSGAGKTTLVNLLFRFFQPQMGSILLDNQDISLWNLENYRSHIGVVPQEAFLFAGSIRDNILCGNPEAGTDQLQEAVKLAHVDEFTDKLPNGLDTVIGERGAKLSGGQRQRIALARVILRNPKIMILDEPTSELDSQSEKFIQDSIEKISADKTTFIIAHRLSTIRNADKIVFLENGTIKEQGSHESLYEECLEYRTLYNNQFGIVN